jgi:hypothetical protein
MSQRETILPVCKLFDVTDGTIGDVPLARTAVYLDKAKYTAPASGSPLLLSGVDSFTYNISGGEGIGNVPPVGTSAVIEVSIVKDSTDTSSIKTSVLTKGSYEELGSSTIGIGVEGHKANDGSGTFDLTMTPTTGSVPYITVTDLSGTVGYFRVFPSSAADLYTSSTGVEVEIGAQLPTGPAASGFPGVIGAPGTTVVLTLQPSMAVDKIHIENQLKVDSRFAINYGVIKDANPLRDQQFPEVL